MAGKVQIDYQEMEAAASKVSTEYEALQSAYENGRAAFDQLKDRWQSPAASDFFTKTSDIMDRYKKLVQAVGDMVDTFHTVNATLREIEETARNEFDWLKSL